MSAKLKRLPVILVGGTIVLGLGLIIISLYSNRITWDRKTAVSAAKYDGEALIKQLADLPATSIEFREVDSGPLAPDLSNVREAWVTWKESFSAGADFPDTVNAYLTRLTSLGWEKLESTDPSIARFGKGEWLVTLTLLSDPGATPIRFSRLIEWKIVVP